MKNFNRGDRVKQRKSDGFKLRIQRQRLGFHQYEIAQRLGINPARLCEFEHGRRTLSPEVENKLRALLGFRSRKDDGGGQSQD